jgi:alanine racemase
MRPEVVTRMEIDLDQLVRNYEAVRADVSPAAVHAVVKSEAYAHGAVPVARALAGAGCRTFAVALVDEGIQLRRAALPGDADAEIMIMGATLPWQYDAMLQHRLTPVLPGAEAVPGWFEAARRSGRGGRDAGYHLKVDVGLGRMGHLPWEGEAAAAAVAHAIAAHAAAGTSPAAAGASHAAACLPPPALLGISGHLSSPGGDEATNTREQEHFARFCSPFVARWPGIACHLAASQAVVRFPHLSRGIVRVGGLLYGMQHLKRPGLDLAPVMTYKTAVAQIRELPAGWHIGYDHKWPVTAPMRMALLPLGWTDIFNSQMVGSADVLIGGVPRRLVGLCTDFAMIDVTGGPPTATGDEVVIIGTQGDHTITAIDLGRRGGISTGQLLGKISLRVPRIYRRASASGCDEVQAEIELSILYPTSGG